MSKALVKKSLELLSFETDVEKDKRKKKKTKSAGALDLIPINHRLISKDKKRGSTSVLKRSSSLTIAEARRNLELRADPVEENVHRLLRLSGAAIDSEISEKIIERATKKRSKKQAKPVEEEGTLFTEEDFKNFEKEYLNIKTDEEHQHFKKEYLKE